MTGSSLPEQSCRVADPAERVRHILGPAYAIDEHDRLVYTWHHGYETLDIDSDNGGGFHFAGAFHPGDGSCSDGGVCRWCGRTLEFD